MLCVGRVTIHYQSVTHIISYDINRILNSGALWDLALTSNTHYQPIKNVSYSICEFITNVKQLKNVYMLNVCYISKITKYINHTTADYKNQIHTTAFSQNLLVYYLFQQFLWRYSSILLHNKCHLTTYLWCSTTQVSKETKQN